MYIENIYIYVYWIYICMNIFWTYIYIYIQLHVYIQNVHWISNIFCKQTFFACRMCRYSSSHNHGSWWFGFPQRLVSFPMGSFSTEPWGGRVNVEKEAFFFALPTWVPGKQPGDEFHVALPPPPPTGCAQGDCFWGLVMDKIAIDIMGILGVCFPTGSLVKVFQNIKPLGTLS